MEWFTDEQMASFQKAADEGKEIYARKQKAKASRERAERERRREELGIKVIKGYNAPK